MYVICPHCKKELDSDLKRLEGKVFHFECVYKYVQGKDYEEPPHGETGTLLSAKQE